MDATQQVVQKTMAWNLNAVKEPRGFMKIIQFVFTICAFATTTSFTTYFSFTVECRDIFNTTKKFLQEVSYPFRLSHASHEENVCGITVLIQYFGDYSSDAQFYVATGVLSFLYSILALAIYVIYDNIYQSNNLIPVGDFIVHVVLAVFWLAGSSAWADGVTQLKSASDPSTWFAWEDVCNMGNRTCTVDSVGHFARLNVSLILGFLNVFLWTANLWFLYKETAWFKSSQPPPPAVTPQQPAMA